MAACRGDFTVVVAEDGEVWAFGTSSEGQLGLGTTAHHLLPARMGGREVFDALVVMVATGLQPSRQPRWWQTDRSTRGVLATAASSGTATRSRS